MTIMDAHSKWQKVFPLRRATTTSPMAALEKVFSTHGIPETLVSGNYTQFNSGKFIEFCTRRSIEHVRTPPYHLQSNGQDERVVDPFKLTLLKEKGEVYRTTPHQNQWRRKTSQAEKSPTPLFLLPDTCNLSHPSPPRIKRAYEPTVPRRSTRTRHDGDPPAKSKYFVTNERDVRDFGNSLLKYYDNNILLLISIY